MRHILTLLVVASMAVTLPAAADDSPTPVDPEASAPSGKGAAVAPQTPHGLANIHGGLTAESARVAGQSRDVELSATAGAAAKVVRPAPTPRALRKMGTERAVAAIDPSVRACASESTLAIPTTFGLRVSVAPSGDVEGAELASTMRVPPALLKCVVKAVSAAHFGAPGATGASVVLPITVPGRAGAQQTAAAPPAPVVSVIVTPPANAPAAPVAAAPSEPKSDDVIAAKQ